MAHATATPGSRILTHATRIPFLLALLTACTPKEQDGSWSLASRPALSIGGVAGDSARDFSRILGGRKLGNGEIIVVNGATGELRWFDAKGQHLRTVRRDTSGFTAITAAFFEGDTALIWDARGRMVSRWDEVGRMLERRRVVLDDSTRTITIRGPMGHGMLLVESSAPLVVAYATEVTRPEGTLFRFNPDGSADSIGTLVGDELFMQRKSGVATVIRLPFGRLTVLATVPGGYLVGDGTAPSITQHDSAGALTRTITWEAMRQPVTAADRDQHLRLLVGAAQSGRRREEIEALWSAMPLPDSLPWLTAIVPDPLGTAWLRSPVHISDTLATWHVVDQGGKVTGTIELPARATPLEIEKDWVLLQQIDKDGIERVELRKLRRPAT